MYNMLEDLLMIIELVPASSVKCILKILVHLMVSLCLQKKKKIYFIKRAKKRGSELAKLLLCCIYVN